VLLDGGKAATAQDLAKCPGIGAAGVGIRKGRFHIGKGDGTSDGGVDDLFSLMCNLQCNCNNVNYTK
jgi:hypothetical protein